MRPLVSIVIDNFNYAEFLGAAIDSALAQSWDRCEVIVVDDGSTDASRTVIDRYGDQIRAIFQANAGQSGAFNTGFAASRGDVVLFLDSDDALRPDAVERVMAAWHPGVSKVQFALASVDAAGRFLGNVFPVFPPSLSAEAIRAEALRTGLYPCPPTSGNAYARSFLAAIMPLERVLAGADGPLNTVAPLYGDVATIDAALGFYRVHGRNDGAHRTLEPRKFARFIRHDQDRAKLLIEHARRRGLRAAADPLRHAPLHLQYRAASLKLRGAEHPVAGETLGQVTVRGIGAALAATGRPLSRVLLAGWFAAIWLLPRTAAERLIAWRFAPGSRPAGLRRMLERLGILRGRTASSDALSLPPTLGAAR